jgi:hypothetical protein
MLALGITLWGLHLAFTQGLLAAMLTDTAPAELRGSAMLLSSIIAGVLWDQFGPSMIFFSWGGV